jgi:hypothetical protein
MKGFPALATVAILTVTVLVLSGSGSTSGGQQHKLKTKHVLILYSYHENLPWERLMDESLRAAVTSKATFHPEIPRLWPALASGRGTLAAPAVPLARRGC